MKDPVKKMKREGTVWEKTRLPDQGLANHAAGKRLGSKIYKSFSGLQQQINKQSN